MLREIVLLILSTFFLKSAWAFNLCKYVQSPIDIDPNSIKESQLSRKQLFFKYEDVRPLEFCTTINKTGDQIGKIFT